MKKKVLIWVLAAVLVLSMAGCAAGAVSSNDKYVGMEPTAAAEAAAAETKDTTSISDLIASRSAICSTGCIPSPTTTVWR